MKMRTRKPAAMVDSGNAIQAETSKHAYIATQVAKNPPNDVVSCPKLRAKIGDWRVSGSVCVVIASKAMLASSPTSWSEREAYGGHHPWTTRFLRRLCVVEARNGKGGRRGAGGMIVVIAGRRVCIRPTLETARAASSEGNEHHDGPRSVLRPLRARTRRGFEGLRALDNAEHPDPRFRLHRLPGDRCASGVCSHDGGGLSAMHVDHITGEQLLAGIIHRAVLRERSETYLAKLIAIRIGTTIGETNQASL